MNTSIRASAVPVFMLRTPFSTEFRRVLLTTDLSAVSAAALRRGVDVAKQLGIPDDLEVRCAMATWVSEWIRPAIPPEKLCGEARRELTRFLERIALPIDNVVAPGIRQRRSSRRPPSGTPTLSWWEHAAVPACRAFCSAVGGGSVLRSAFCNVLVVPPAAGRPAEAELAMSAAEPVLA
jgi:hypothetical protein